MRITLTPAKKRDYKFTAIINGKEVNFGREPFEDFTDHKDEERKRLYLARHKPVENWTKGGLLTPGFWARWLLWNKPSIKESVDDIEDRFNLKIVERR